MGNEGEIDEQLDNMAVSGVKSSALATTSKDFEGVEAARAAIARWRKA